MSKALLKTNINCSLLIHQASQAVQFHELISSGHKEGRKIKEVNLQ